MRKAISLLMIFVLAFSLTACGDKLPGAVAGEGGLSPQDQAMAGVVQAPDADVAGDSDDDSDDANASSDGSATSEAPAEEELIPAGKYTAYEIYMQQHMPDVYIEVISSSDTQLTFSYASYSGEFFDTKTVSLDSTHKGYIDLNDSIALNIEIKDGKIRADECEAMGAMAFEFTR